MFDVSIHCQSVRLARFWPGNGNQLDLEFSPRVWGAEWPHTTKQTVWLGDAARAWEIYDALKDERTELTIKDTPEEEFRKIAAAQKTEREEKARLRKEREEAGEPVVDDADELEVPY